eukprot:CAMPEP_0113724066 /NCGR_PEP_ID=MMETSP0038_2-20120614/38835_1 /TAXON_ID=2898 /ORGANISM="Cryptomonas paramecium" /LENGTH=44 /DNA_ID=CAMNT_0000653851 /DNA_START=82 /DNA_END=213 /DNA_ORIENTATION=- /assembly_acc=CAM_ASM_000170
MRSANELASKPFASGSSDNASCSEVDGGSETVKLELLRPKTLSI